MEVVLGDSEHDEVPGTRMEIDWPRLVSAGDVKLSTPPPDSYQGIVLGNGDIGTSVFGGPELIRIHVGKNDIWDYRDFMDDKRPITHKEFLGKFADPSKPPLTHYLADEKGQPSTADAHNADIRNAYLRPAPSIKPAGQIRFRNSWLAGRGYEGRLALWNAAAAVQAGRTEPTLETFVSYPRNLIVVHYDPQGAGPFDIELARHHDCAGIIPNGPEFGAEGRDLWVRYQFPADPVSYPDGFEYVMYGRVLGGDTVTTETIESFAEIMQDIPGCQVARKPVKTMEGVAVAHVRSTAPVTLLAAVYTTRDDRDPLARARREVDEAERAGRAELTNEHQAWWHGYWRRSCIDLAGKPFLNGVWYFSQYLLACAWREGKVAPGLFGPWTWEDWPLFGNDYHWDYNMQQAVWGAYSSNHLEQTRPYNEAALALLPTAEVDARETYGIDGAKFFLCSYPRKHPHNPFPLLHYDKMMSINGWVAHPLWWMYLYGQDTSYLRTQAYPLMRECAKFYAGYLTQASDGKYDIWPTAAWDIDFTPHLRDNRNFPLDLSLVRYLLRACAAASEVLELDQEQRETWRSIADNLREYPTADAPSGEVFTPYPGSTTFRDVHVPGSMYNWPLATTMVFPGDDIGLDSPSSLRETALRTLAPLRYNGDEQLLTSVMRARLGVDDMEGFQRQLARTTRPNGTLSYRWLDASGKDCGGQSFFWVHGAGNSLWHNENLMQSYNGKIRIAPVKLSTAARFANLRAVGAFLVSAEIMPGGEVSYITIASEAGRGCRLIRPWEGETRVRALPSMEPVSFTAESDSITFATSKASVYVVDRPSRPWEQQTVSRLPGTARE
jgi:hypothetical protein